MIESSRENVAKLLPVITQFERKFWDGLAARQLLIQKCPECGNAQFPPSPVCTACLSDRVQWTPCSGKATLWSRVTFHKQYLDPYPAPYGVALARLEERPIVTGRISDENTASLKFDDPLNIEFRETADGTVVLEFTPVVK